MSYVSVFNIHIEEINERPTFLQINQPREKRAVGHKRVVTGEMVLQGYKENVNDWNNQ